MEKQVIVIQYVGEKPYDTLTLLVAGDSAWGSHYQDNGEDYAYRDGVYNLYKFTQKHGALSIELVNAGYADRYEGFKISMNGKNFKVKFSGRKLAGLR